MIFNSKISPQNVFVQEHNLTQGYYSTCICWCFTYFNFKILI